MRGLPYLILVICLVVASHTFAQETTPTAAAPATTDTGGFHMTKSPTEAILLSAALPGLGQVYLDQVWKVPILYGIIGGFLYGVLIQDHRYHQTIDEIHGDSLQAQQYYSKGDAPDSLRGDHSLLQAQRLFSSREFYRDDRDKWLIYLGITYVVQILDAYIASHLYDFDVSNPAPSQIQSYYDPLGGRVGLAYQLRF
jgi:hypothetical protein